MTRRVKYTTLYAADDGAPVARSICYGGIVRHDTVPEAVREAVAEERWEFSSKVELCLEDGDYTRPDLQCCVLQGRLDKRERDEYGTALDGWKYTVHGHTIGGRPFYVCGKLKAYADGTVFFYITAHVRR